MGREGLVSMAPRGDTALGKQGINLLWDKQEPCIRGILAAEGDLGGSARICMASEDSSVQFIFLKLFWGGKIQFSSSPSRAGKAGAMGWIQTMQFKLPEVASAQGLPGCSWRFYRKGWKLHQSGCLKANRKRALENVMRRLVWVLTANRSWWERPVPALLQQEVGTGTVDSMGHSTFPLDKRVKGLSIAQRRIRASKYHYEYLGIILRGKASLKVVFHPLPFFGRGWNHTLLFWNANIEYQPTSTVQNKTYT